MWESWAFSSNLANVTSGVLQGSILGPLLFLQSFNGIFELKLSDKSCSTGYADDVTYSKAVFNESDVMSVNSDLATIHLWLVSKNLRLNLSKVKWMLISRKKKVPAITVSVEDHVVERLSLSSCWALAGVRGPFLEPAHPKDLCQG